jgi:hypothetical protein
MESEEDDRDWCPAAVSPNDDEKKVVSKMKKKFTESLKCVTAGAWSAKVKEMRRRSMVKELR